MVRRRCDLIAGLLLVGLTIWNGVARGQPQLGPIRHDPAQAGANPAGPVISTLPPIIYIGDNFTIQGSGFDPNSVVNFFVASSSGAENFGPLVPNSILTDNLTAFVPISVSQGEGVASVEVVNTDQDHIASNAVLALLQGDASAGLPSLTAINGVGLSPTSVDPGVAVANVETVVRPGASVTLTGSGFDVTNGVGVDLFCDCPGGKAGTFWLTSSPSLGANSLTFILPSGPSGVATGPGSFRVTNLGNLSASAAVSVPVGARIVLSAVSQKGSTMHVTGAGFSNLTVINLFNLQAGMVLNLGGLNPDGSPVISFNLISDGELDFALPAGVVPGPAYVQLLNPPFIPFTSTGNTPAGAFTAN